MHRILSLNLPFFQLSLQIKPASLGPGEKPGARERREIAVRAPSPEASQPPQGQCQRVVACSDLCSGSWSVAVSFLGETEALAVEPARWGSAPIFPSRPRDLGPSDAHPHAADPHTRPGAPLVPVCSWNWGSDRALRQPPTHADSCPVRASPHPRCALQDHPLPRQEPGGEYLARTSGAAEGAQPAGARQPFLQPREPRVKCPARLQNGLPAPAGPRPAALRPLHLGPPPGLCFAFVPPLEALLSRGEGGGEGGLGRGRGWAWAGVLPGSPTAAARGAPEGGGVPGA